MQMNRSRPLWQKDDEDKEQQKAKKQTNKQTKQTKTKVETDRKEKPKVQQMSFRRRCTFFIRPVSISGNT